jgi:hypothetical protein
MKKISIIFLLVINSISNYAQPGICLNYEVSNDSLIFNSTGDTFEINIQCHSVYWQIESLPNWLKSNITSGNTDTTITFIVSNNIDVNSRDTSFFIWGSCNFYRLEFKSLCFSKWC